MGTGGNDTMFQASPFNLTEYTETCIEVFGGHDKNLHSEILQATSSSPMDFGIHTVLECFGGHIRHCCCCTYRTRVLEDISDSVVALYTEQGAHFLDLYPSSLSGPDWLVALREKDKQILHIGLLSSMPNMINNS
ncbi:uncharacterized protein LOC18094909 isoform X4 [Populus trichocarpa]|uniref:Uncharacterized protein n=1 Tax=Populus trichocarpa TaxID=3694 RepID=A0A3N7EB45_POPTR|nr:uncharacterized protein LOC18094909 isoform X4 [Populus trichocarpa]|eukprot:XP_024440605.1 uncharacterized protein LOC18094909 isoform X4 [Populus trichocarpa]